MSDLCRYLPWDSAFFGWRIGRLSADVLTEDIWARARAWCAAQRIDCLYFLARPDDPETARLTLRHGFLQTDIRLTLAGRFEQADGAEVARVATEADIPALRAIAQVAYAQSRFYFDPHFDDARSGAMYAHWIEQSVRGAYDDTVIVLPGPDGAPLAYTSCRVGSVGVIGLVGVSEAARGQGYGRRIIRAALDWFIGQGVHDVEVTTQGRNIGGQRLYQRCGFVTARVGLWYHKWFAVP